MHSFLKFILGMRLYMLRTFPLSIMRSFSLHTHSNDIFHTGLLTACEQDQDGSQFHPAPIRKLSACEQDQDGIQFNPAPVRKLSANLYDIHNCCVCVCVCSEKFLIMDTGTVRNMCSFIPRINLRNECI
jgi:hypothetical protein